jgi:hypothetical protein
VACDHRADDEQVYEALVRATAPLSRAWERLERASTIALKFNQDWRLERVLMHEGRRRQLVCDAVARAVLRLLRERTRAELLCVDASYSKIYGGTTPAETTRIAPLLEEYGVRYVDGTEPPLREVEVPGGGLMFRSYTLPEELVGADAVVSVAKIKNHAFMGVTGCLKNLFGLMPAEPYARPRHYYHHLVRMPYLLADLGRILDPALNVVDALVGQARSEWGREPADARVVDALIAGDNVVATDACMARLMGHDPRADWRTDPFLRDRNALLAAEEGGFGATRIEEIDYTSEVEPCPPGTFFCDEVDDAQTVVAWRRSMCEQALGYRDDPGRFEGYAGQYVLIQRGQVRWHDPEGRVPASRRELAGEQKNESLYFKFVDPEEREAERYGIYERALEKIREEGL